MKRVLFLAIAVMLAGSVAAQMPRVQFGARVGIFSQDLQLTPGDFINKQSGDTDRYTTDAVMGFNAAIVTRVRLTGKYGGTLGLGLFIQPEIIYSQNNYKIQQKDEDTGDGPISEIRMQSVDIPLLASAKISIVRVQFGPVFNVMYENNTIEGDINIIPSRPSVGYALGASVDIVAGLVLDGRYNGQFKDLKNNIKSGETVYNSVRGSLSSWSLGLSYLF